jgi:hypothetical protein
LPSTTLVPSHSQVMKSQQHSELSHHQQRASINAPQPLEFHSEPQQSSQHPPQQSSQRASKNSWRPDSQSVDGEKNGLITKATQAGDSEGSYVAIVRRESSGFHIEMAKTRETHEKYWSDGPSAELKVKSFVVVGGDKDHQHDTAASRPQIPKSLTPRPHLSRPPPSILLFFLLLLWY